MYTAHGCGGCFGSVDRVAFVVVISPPRSVVGSGGGVDGNHFRKQLACTLMDVSCRNGWRACTDTTTMTLTGRADWVPSWRPSRTIRDERPYRTKNTLPGATRFH
eukprot:scaffold24048_cov194-Amphora_coffeaeformis.AAC.27